MTKMTHTGGLGNVMTFMYERLSADQPSELLKDSLPALNHVFALLPLHVYSP